MKAIKLAATTLLVLFLNQPMVQAQSKKEVLEQSVHKYLYKNFNTSTQLFTYVGNVDIRSASEKVFGTYYLEGEFDYRNLADIQVRRKFRATVTPFLGEYTIQKIEFYTYDLEKWVWVQI